ncbi:antitoxin [Bifidobacterium pseudocatenulatum]|uniref:Antitoxin n=1 Tax=Bifidobacterium pseudocatenulatum TaxID=28026 RepID=A0A413KAZ5_BIFPS|nr:antitoxin [Bifidobacterium pseudocatenulatum]
MKKILENMIRTWHQSGYALDEIAPLVPQVPKAEIAAIIHQYDKEARL